MQTIAASEIEQEAGRLLASKKDYPPQINLFLHSSNYGLEYDLPHPKGSLVMTAYEKGMLCVSEYLGSKYYGLITWEDVTALTFTRRYTEETHRGYRLAYFAIFAVLVAVFYLLAFTPDKTTWLAVLFNTVLFGGILGGVFSALYPEKILYRSLVIHCANGREAVFKMYEGNLGRVSIYFQKYLAGKVTEPSPVQNS